MNPGKPKPPKPAGRRRLLCRAAAALLRRWRQLCSVQRRQRERRLITAAVHCCAVAVAAGLESVLDAAVRHFYGHKHALLQRHIAGWRSCSRRAAGPAWSRAALQPGAPAGQAMQGMHVDAIKTCNVHTHRCGDPACLAARRPLVRARAATAAATCGAQRPCRPAAGPAI